MVYGSSRGFPPRAKIKERRGKFVIWEGSRNERSQNHDTGKRPLPGGRTRGPGGRRRQPVHHQGNLLLVPLRRFHQEALLRRNPQQDRLRRGGAGGAGSPGRLSPPYCPFPAPTHCCPQEMTFLGAAFFTARAHSRALTRAMAAMASQGKPAAALWL